MNQLQPPHDQEDPQNRNIQAKEPIKGIVVGKHDGTTTIQEKGTNPNKKSSRNKKNEDKKGEYPMSES